MNIPGIDSFSGLTPLGKLSTLLPKLPLEALEDMLAGKISLKLVAGKGDAHLHAQSGDVEIIGDQSLRLTACQKKLVASAKEEMLLVCAGAYIRMKGGNIDIHCPGNLSFKSAGHSHDGPTGMDEKHPAAAQGRIKEEELLKLTHFSG